MADPWVIAGTISSVAAALGGVAAAVIAWRVFQWQRRAEQPVVTCFIYPAEGSLAADGWLAIVITVHSPPGAGWQIVEIDLGRASGVERSAAMQPTGQGGRRLDSESLRPGLAHVLPLQTHVPGGEGRSVTIYSSRELISSINLSMRLSLLSNEAAQRKLTIPVTRRLPPSGSEAPT